MEMTKIVQRHKHVIAVIPAYNEAETIIGVVHALRERELEVIVVDDGSEDATGEYAEAAGALVLRHAVNLGQGAALHTGIDEALRRNADIVITYDADDQFNPDDIDILIQCLLESGVDVVLGNRFLKKQHIPLARYFLLKTATIFTRLTTGLSVYDTHNGLRAFTRNAAETITISQPRMAHASEILSEIAAHSLTFMEAPVSIRYTEYSKKKGQTTSASLRILMDLFFRK